MSARPADLPSLTAIRGFAAWYVVLFHIRTSIDWLPPQGIQFLARGYLAVDLFFVLSGFVIWLNYADRLRSEGRAGIIPFLWRRLARIWPLHIFLLCGVIALALLFAATGRADPVRYPFAELPLHIALLQNWGFTQELSWNIPAWSISTEWAAYLLFPLIVWIDWRRWPTAALVLPFALILVALVFVYWPHGTVYIDVPRLGLARCLAEFTIGTIICALWQRSTRSASSIAGAIMLATGPVLWWSGLWEVASMPIAFAGLVLLLAGQPQLLSQRVAVYLGEISYSTYLSHTLVWIAFKLAFVSDAEHVGPAAIAAYLASVMVGSALLHRWVELPAQRWLNARAPAASTRPPPPSAPRSPTTAHG